MLSKSLLKYSQESYNTPLLNRPVPASTRLCNCSSSALPKVRVPRTYRALHSEPASLSRSRQSPHVGRLSAYKASPDPLSDHCALHGQRYPVIEIQSETLRVYSKEERLNHYELCALTAHSHEGQLFQKVNGERVRPKGDCMYVLMPDKRLILAPSDHVTLLMAINKNPNCLIISKHDALKNIDWKWVHHSSLAQHQPVICAGHIGFDKNGDIEYINNDSGHYKPKRKHLDNTVEILHKYFNVHCSQEKIFDVQNPEKAQEFSFVRPSTDHTALSFTPAQFVHYNYNNSQKPLHQISLHTELQDTAFEMDF